MSFEMLSHRMALVYQLESLRVVRPTDKFYCLFQLVVLRWDLSNRLILRLDRFQQV